MLTNKHIGLLLTLLLLPLLAAGCMQNNAVKLSYATSKEPGTCKRTAVIYRFLDQREKKGQLGYKEDGSPILAKADVVDWVGWALFDELTAAGCDTKYRTVTVTGDSAVVTGEILEVALDQTGTTTYKGRVALNIRVRKDGRDVHVEKFISEVEDVVLPAYASPSDVLAAALRGALTAALPVICENL